VGLSISFLCDQSEVKLLVSTQLHDQDWVLFVTFVVDVANGTHTMDVVACRLWLYIVRGNFTGVLVGWANLQELIAHGTLLTELTADAGFISDKIVLILGVKRHQPESVSNKFVI